MQVEPASLITALNGVVAQRLVRQICPDCIDDTTPSDDLLAAWQSGPLQQLTPALASRARLRYLPRQRFRGRLALAEVLHFSDAMKEAMLARSPRRKLKEVALNDGFVPLSTIARAPWSKAKPREEVNRVITH